MANNNRGGIPLLIAQRLQRDGIAFLSVTGRHTQNGPSIDEAVVECEADRARLVQWAEREQMGVRLARIASAAELEEHRRWAE